MSERMVTTYSMWKHSSFGALIHQILELGAISPLRGARRAAHERGFSRDGGAAWHGVRGHREAPDRFERTGLAAYLKKSSAKNPKPPVRNH